MILLGSGVAGGPNDITEPSLGGADDVIAAVDARPQGSRGRALLHLPQR